MKTKETMELMPRNRAGHEFNTGKYCSNLNCKLTYHYSCDDCGTDCTQGTPGGPATQNTDGARRCYHCNLKHEQKTMRLRAAAPEMVKVLTLADELLATLDDVTVTGLRLLIDQTLRAGGLR